MVGMDKSEYVVLSRIVTTLGDEKKIRVTAKIRTILKDFYNAGFVYGDIHCTNILVNPYTLGRS